MQAVQDYGDEALDRSRGGEAASRRHCVQAVVGELLGGDIVPEVAGRGSLGHEPAD